ncbi:MAG TPA: phosphatase PAP2 family protein [Gaiellaceae bacterium]|nr:phosphatase PAP2 family protein [Gaiellaceae bacterium]
MGLSIVGFAGALWIVLAAALALGWRPYFLVPLLVTAASVWSADLAALGLKHAIDRPRPRLSIPEAHPLMGAGGDSMPSGHAATAFAGAVVLTYLWRRGAPFFFVLAAAIAFARIYVGVHYPTDVLAGAALGAVVGAVWVVALRPPRPSAGGRPRSGAGPPAG